MSNQKAVELARVLVEQRNRAARVKRESSSEIEQRRADDVQQAAEWQFGKLVPALLAEVERLRAALQEIAMQPFPKLVDVSDSEELAWMRAAQAMFAVAEAALNEDTAP